MKKYNKAPLPFQGQKRNFLNKFKEALNEFPEDAIYIDLFGGSGLLSHTVKTFYPNSHVIYNDFDKYSERLKNIDKTNNLIKDIRTILSDVPYNSKVNDVKRIEIIERIKTESCFVDYITLSSNILFSGRVADNLKELEKQSFYNRIVNTDYNSENYLNGVEIVTKDYRELFKKYKEYNNIIFLLDPPYLSTDVTRYKNMGYWKLTNYLDVLKTIEDRSFFYFTSSKSQIIELLDWLHVNQYKESPFNVATTKTVYASTGDGNGYEDIMIYKYVGR
ncbi:hypothetical protein OK18_15215 [Chryseobacterium gallinarum]|uniref:DNA methyltransferase n=1 Tax=Chryseobacterium gallinarum TaxID=1324352 RepID=A0A0G3M711_CHRGL|nr:hypothetical protein [Chryseobacterium gallinarum]AKK73773.1 hypothetical protein OK18_15215 [Chryseobacterium gallinarum]